MVLMAMSIALSFALRMFWHHFSIYDIWMLLLVLYIPDPMVFLSICPSEFLVGGGE